MEAEKKAILKQRIVPLNIDGMDQSGLTEKAKELHKVIYRLEGEKYDLEKRFKTQQLDVSEHAHKSMTCLNLSMGTLKMTDMKMADHQNAQA